MTITELQNKLQEISENYGDIEVKIKEAINWNESYYFDDDIDYESYNYYKTYKDAKEALNRIKRTLSNYNNELDY